jgi:hypothetical protein
VIIKGLKIMKMGNYFRPSPLSERTSEITTRISSRYCRVKKEY